MSSGETGQYRQSDTTMKGFLTHLLADVHWIEVPIIATCLAYFLISFIRIRPDFSADETLKFCTLILGSCVLAFYSLLSSIKEDKVNSIRDNDNLWRSAKNVIATDQTQNSIIKIDDAPKDLITTIRNYVSDAQPIELVVYRRLFKLGAFVVVYSVLIIVFLPDYLGQ